MKKIVILLFLLLTAGTMYGALYTITLNSFNQGQWQLGYPYTVTINGVPNISVMCNDYFHGGLPSDTWKTQSTNLGTGNTAHLRFSHTASALVY